MNYQSNHRDCQAWRDDNLEMSTTSNEAVKLLDYALDQMFCHTPDLSVGGPMGTIDKMLEADENFAMARIMAIGLNGGSCRNNKDIADAVTKLKGISDDKLNAREKLHRKAVIHWANEDKLDACRTWEEILLQHPRDTMALLFSYYGYILTGQSRMLRDCISRILPCWRKQDFHYGYLQGYYAFGLEQTNMFDLAEKAVKESLELIPNNSWAMHAYSHIFDATGRSQEGIDFLNENESKFSENNTLACHLYWHQTVNYTETGDYDRVLEIFDQKISPAFKSSGITFNINDACQLLQRLEFEGVNVGDRWNDVYASYKPQFEKHDYAYDDAHMLTSFVRSKAAREDNVKDDFIVSLEEYAKHNIGNNGNVTQDVLLELSQGIIAYSEKQYEEAVDHMIPIYKDIYRLGGSNAQRDIFHQFVINACIRSPLPNHQTMARCLLNERKLYRPTSLLTDRVFATLQKDH